MFTILKQESFLLLAVIAACDDPVAGRMNAGAQHGAVVRLHPRPVLEPDRAVAEGDFTQHIAVQAGERHLSYAELLGRIHQTANALHALGMGASDTVAI